MPEETARWVFPLVLAAVALAMALVIRQVRRRSHARSVQAESLTAAEVRANAPTVAPGAAFIYAVSLDPNAGRGMQILVRNQDDETVGTIGFPLARGTVLRTIECAEGAFECHRMFGMTADKASLHRSGSDAIRMLFEPGVGRERYTCNGEVRYERNLLAAVAPDEWRIESHGDTVARLINLRAVYGTGAMMLVPQRELPLIDQLFLIAMSNRSAARG